MGEAPGLRPQNSTLGLGGQRKKKVALPPSPMSPSQKRRLGGFEIAKLVPLVMNSWRFMCAKKFPLVRAGTGPELKYHQRTPDG